MAGRYNRRIRRGCECYARPSGVLPLRFHVRTRWAGKGHGNTKTHAEISCHSRVGKAPMSRSVTEWIGKDDNTPVPDRVRLRVFDKHNGRCYICTRKVLAGEYWESDHVKALINGGENRERNLAPACCNCCRPKTAQDVAEKSQTYDMRRKHVLPKQSKRPFPKRLDPWGKNRRDNTKRLEKL